MKKSQKKKQALHVRDYLVISENNMHNRNEPKWMTNTRLYPDISALIYNAVALNIEEFRSPVGNGAPLGCPVLYGHGFPGSSNLK